MKTYNSVNAMKLALRLNPSAKSVPMAVVEFYPNGNLKSQTGYMDGIKDGPSIGWYESGALRYEDNWVLGQMVSFVNYEDNPAKSE